MLEKERRLCQNRFYEFFLRAWPTLNHNPLINNWHIRLFCDELQLMLDRVIAGEKKQYDLIINTPPKTLKSQICSVSFPAWAWAKAPWLRIITCSYSPELVMRDCVDCRKLISSEWYQQLWGQTYKLTSDAMEHMTTDKGGDHRTTSPGSSKTGHKADVIIADDPNRASDRYSEAERTQVNNWWSDTMFSRLDNQEVGIRIVIQQRIDQSDLTGFIQTNYPDKYAILSLPSDLSKGHKPYPIALKDFYKDGLMFPTRLNRSVLKEAEASLRTAYEGQYLQSPVVVGGRFFKESWPRWYTPSQLPIPEHIIISVDTSQTEGGTPVSIQAWAYKAPNAYLLHDLTEGMAPEAQETAVRRVASQFPGCSLVIENTASGFGLVQQMSKTHSVYAFKPNQYGGKETRASMIAYLWAQGNVYLPDTQYFRTEFLNEILTFPGSKFCDRVDAMSQALIYLTQLLPQTSRLLHLGS